MSTFGLTVGSSSNDVIGALNYALANIVQSGGNNTTSTFTVNTSTGQVFLPGTGAVFSYVYQYLFIAYADSADGATGFSDTPTNKSYYGLRNSASSTGSDNNPANYIWYQVAGGFGTDKVLWYSVTGVGFITIVIAVNAPNTDGTWIYDQLGNAYTSGIDLNVITNIVNYPGNVTSYIMVDNFYLLGVFTVNGKGTSTFYTATNVTVGGSYYVQSVPVTGYNTTTYYLSFNDGGYSQFQEVAETIPVSVAQDFGITYTVTPDFINTTVNNLLTLPNVQINQALNLQPLAAIPTIYSTGTIAVADLINWDPAGVGSGNPYMAFYNGVSWVKLG